MTCSGPTADLAELAYLEADPAQVGLVDAEGLVYRGMMRTMIGDLGQAVTDLTASLRLVRQGAIVILGVRPYCYLALAQYLAGLWDDALLTTEQGLSVAAINAHRHELPLLHMVAACVPAGQRGHPDQAREIYQHGEDTADPQSPLYTARLLLAHGQLLRRTGDRKAAVERLQRANTLFSGLRAAPFMARTEEELAACHLPGSPATKQSALALTSRETEVAHLVGKGLSNPEIAAELFISRKAVEYHLGNIYAKCGLHGRQQLRRFVGQWRQPAAI